MSGTIRMSLNRVGYPGDRDWTFLSKTALAVSSSLLLVAPVSLVESALRAFRVVHFRLLTHIVSLPPACATAVFP